MPTGYTAAVGTGEISTLKQFALSCARGMGACITMRDDPSDAPIPERFEPSTEYYEKNLEAAKTRLSDIDTLSETECDALAEEAHATRLAAHEQYEADRKAENDRYRDMLAAVRAWQTEAEGIKEFMSQQLEISISDYLSPPPQKLNGPAWREETRLKALHDIAYHEKAMAEEVHRTEMRNLWLAALRRSLPAE